MPTSRHAYETARSLLATSHCRVLEMIESFSNDELFTRKYFTWTGTTSLGSYFVSATSSTTNGQPRRLELTRKSHAKMNNWRPVNYLLQARVVSS
ncbi:ClbS/DfsB family four-helix bundle protein [Trueperella pyogenes]